MLCGSPRRPPLSQASTGALVKLVFASSMAFQASTSPAPCLSSRQADVGAYFLRGGQAVLQETCQSLSCQEQPGCRRPERSRWELETTKKWHLSDGFRPRLVCPALGHLTHWSQRTPALPLPGCSSRPWAHGFALPQPPAPELEEKSQDSAEHLLTHPSRAKARKVHVLRVRALSPLPPAGLGDLQNGLGPESPAGTWPESACAQIRLLPEWTCLRVGCSRCAAWAICFYTASSGPAICVVSFAMTLHGGRGVRHCARYLDVAIRSCLL